MNLKKHEGTIQSKKLKNDDSYAFLELLHSELQQHNQTVTDGWDAVSFISADAINKLWESRWKQEMDATYKGEKQFLQKITVTSHTTYGKLDLKTVLYMELGAPLINFIKENSQDTQIKILIKKANVQEYVNDTLQQEITYESTEKDSYYLIFICSMQSFDGKVDRYGSVSIDISNGTPSIDNIDFDPLIESDLCKSISDEIKKHGLPPWYLGKIKYDFDEEYLKPKHFYFKSYCSQKPDYPDVLGIYILTITENPPEYGMRQTWGKAWVIGKECNAAVYFSPKLLMNYEMNSAFTPYFGPIDSNTESFQNPIRLYEATITCQTGWYYSPFSHDDSTSDYTATVTLPTSSIKFNFNLNGFILSCDASWDESFPYQYTQVDSNTGQLNYSVHYDNFSYTCKFNTTFIEPSIDSNTFIISFPEITINGDVSASAEPHPGHSDDGDWTWPSTKYAPESFATGAIDGIKKHFENVKIQLKAMPMFAVSNILFPEGKMLTPKKVAFPGDMAILGTALEDYSPSSK